MKIFTANSVYVQKNDIAYLNQTNLDIPASIFMRVFGNIDDSNRYDFVEFDAPEEVQFFKGIDWIIDYNEIKDLSEGEIVALGQSIAEDKNSIAQRFNSMTLEERKENMNLKSQCELLDFKMYSLEDFLLFKQGRLKMKLPGYVDLPVGFEQDKGIRKLIRTILIIRRR